MEIYREALGHAHATLEEIAAGVGKKPKVTKRALARLAAAGKASVGKIGGSTAQPFEGKRVISETCEKNEEKSHLGWEELKATVRACQKCPLLANSRTNVVFGAGNNAADLVFVGEAPGETEDLEGVPFIGKAGNLLTKIIDAMGLSREKIFIANVLKCRPDMKPGESGNRKPTAEEMATCLPWLGEQLRLIQPKVIVALGKTATEGLLGREEQRGQWAEYAGIPVMVTWHPAYLLRAGSLENKRKVWEDMLLVMERMKMPISEKQRGFFLA